MLEIKIVSGLEKPFIDSSLDDYTKLTSISALKGERITFEIIYRLIDDGDGLFLKRLRPTLYGGLAKYATLKNIKSVPVLMPGRHHIDDKELLRTAPGLYPDVCIPLSYGGEIRPYVNQVGAILVDITVPENYTAIGNRELTIEFTCPALDNKVIASASIFIDVIDAVLPEQSLIYTQWFHCDCLAHFYDTEMWSDKHWTIIESFVKTAVKNGINMILTPIFTPPLDTERFGERLTAQLVEVTKDDGRYCFDFSLLDKWMDVCKNAGIKYFEMSHLFTQAGAKNAPKIMGRENGKYKRLFGWETDSSDKEYHVFLSNLIKALVAHIDERGDLELCYFHISDEPRPEHLETYRMASRVIKENIGKCKIMDAMSHVEFYNEKAVDVPVVYIGKIKDFLSSSIPELWGYYCGQAAGISGNLIAMPSCRTRSIGMQLYKYGIAGLLQWGYNFYNNCDSVDSLNPYLDTSGEGWVSGGDTFAVYPGKNGDCLESLRIITTKAAIDDMRAMQLCETFYGKQAVIEAIENLLGHEIDFSTCVSTNEKMQAIREHLNSMIKKALDR